MTRQLSNLLCQPLNLQKLSFSVRSSALSYLPKLIKPSLQLVPFRAQKALLIPVLHSIFKAAIADGDFEFLTGKWLKISVTDLDLQWWLSFQHSGFIMAPPSHAVQEDVSFSASGDDLLLIAGRKQDPDTLFFQRRLQIEGDTELGLEVKNLIDAIDVEQVHPGVYQVINTLAEIVQQTQQEIKDARSIT